MAIQLVTKCEKLQVLNYFKHTTTCYQLAKIRSNNFKQTKHIESQSENCSPKGFSTCFSQYFDQHIGHIARSISLIIFI